MKDFYERGSFMAWDLSSDRPIYSQILEKMQTRIICGRYKPGERLPSVRELAAQANVNPNTMQRALSELERSGLVLTQRSSGRTVTEDTQMIADAKLEIALSAIKSFLANMYELGYHKEEIMQFISNLEE